MVVSLAQIDLSSHHRRLDLCASWSDLHLGNVLFALPGLDSITPEQLYEQYMPPTKEPIVRSDSLPHTVSAIASLPSYAVPAGSFGQGCTRVTLADAGILITDFGESWSPGSRDRFELNTPRWYQPPECLFARRQNRPITLAADIWTLAASIHLVLGQHALFECFAPDQDHVFADMISTLGRPPDAWWNIWEARKEFFNDKDEWDVKLPRMADGEWRLLDHRVGLIRRDRSRLKGETFEEGEEQDFRMLLESMLQWEPEARATAEELLDGVWMQKWGRPAMQRMEEACSQAS